jgi:hypothetical protein
LLCALLLICHRQHCNNNNNYYYYNNYYKYNKKPYITTMSTEEANDDARITFSFGKRAFALQHAMDLRGDSDDDYVESVYDDDDDGPEGVTETAWKERT